MRRLSASLVFACFVVTLGSSASYATDLLVLPKGVLPPAIPADNPLTQAKADLGRKLFFDKRLSKDGSLACASCHDPAHAFVDSRPGKTSAGFGGAVLPRNSPTMLNVAYSKPIFWDGRLAQLEDQVKGALTGQPEMGFSDPKEAPAKVMTIAEYKPLFKAAFGDEAITMERIQKSVASFERTLVSFNAPIDRFVAGDQTAISESAKRGWALFNGKAACSSCHFYSASAPFFSDGQFHNIGVAAGHTGFEQVGRSVLKDPQALASNAAMAPELGRFTVTKKEADLGSFRTPQLRNVALTAPYMHDGSEATLLGVIEYYDRGGTANQWLDPRMRKLGLTAQEKTDLVELLKTFTGDDLSQYAKLGKVSR